MLILKKMRALLRRGTFRMITTTTTTTSGGGGGGPKSPWLMIQPSNNLQGATIFRFWCCAEQKKHIFYDNKRKSRGGEYLIDCEYVHLGNLYLVGSSQGWLAYKLKSLVYLIDPTTYHCIQLPSLTTHCIFDTLILSPDDHESEGKALMIYGAGDTLALCSPRRRSRHWTPFGGCGNEDEGERYESIVYSTAHRRLFCITSKFKLEAWDVDGECPRLECAVHCDVPDEIGVIRRNLLAVKYLVCEEQSGELFLVMRNFHVQYNWEWDPTVEFEVYKVDLQLMKIKKMKGSLQGLSMFVGMNHPVAIRHVEGLKPDCVYFTYDHRIRRSSFVGIYDYQKRVISRLRPSPISECPVWFTPTLYRRNM